MSDSKSETEVKSSYENDPTLCEITKGVFVSVADAVYIVDEKGEVASWNQDEWAEDPESVTACIVASVIAAKKGPGAVRNRIDPSGSTGIDTNDNEADSLRNLLQKCLPYLVHSTALPLFDEVTQELRKNK